MAGSGRVVADNAGLTTDPSACPNEGNSDSCAVADQGDQNDCQRSEPVQARANVRSFVRISRQPDGYENRDCAAERDESRPNQSLSELAKGGDFSLDHLSRVPVPI